MDIIKRKLLSFLDECRMNICNRINRPDIIYHYTSFDMLPLFLEEGADIWATHSSVLNDRAEIITGFNLFCKALSEKYNCVCDSDLMRELRKEFVLARTDAFSMPYIFSFSHDGDSLPQWRGYTNLKDGGYAIGFSVQEIDASIKGYMTEETNCGWMLFLMPCIYTSDTRRIQQIVQRGLNLFNDIFDNYFIDNKDLKYARRVVDLLAVMSSFIKDDGFESENEWRVIVKVDQIESQYTACNHYEDICSGEERRPEYLRGKIWGGKPRVETRINGALKNLHGLIREVRISPQGNYDKLQTCLNLIASGTGIRFAPKRQSEIPYR